LIKALALADQVNPALAGNAKKGGSSKTQSNSLAGGA